MVFSIRLIISLLVETPTEQLLASYLSLMITINMIYFFRGSYHLLTLSNDDMSTSIYRYWSFRFTSHFNFFSFPAGKADHWKVIFYQSRYTEYNKVGAYIISVKCIFSLPWSIKKCKNKRIFGQSQARHNTKAIWCLFAYTATLPACLQRWASFNNHFEQKYLVYSY